MLLGCFLLFFLGESTVKSQTINPLYLDNSTTAVGEMSPLQLVATPDYPVAAGQTVSLQCSAVTMSVYVNWFWQRVENQTWKVVSYGRNLTLTEPKESGLYSCCAVTQLSHTITSPNHTVYIVAMLPRVGENLGIAAFVLSLLALIINFAILFWLGWQRFAVTLTTSTTATKVFPGPEKAPKGGFPQTESDGDVYMNYTSTNQAYTDLDPTNRTMDNVYSTLS